MAKTIRNREIVEKLSNLYRVEKKRLNDFSDELQKITLELYNHEKDSWKNITVAEHDALKMRQSILEQNKKLQEKYCDGISIARELVMDFGYDTYVNTSEK